MGRRRCIVDRTLQPRHRCRVFRIVWSCVSSWHFVLHWTWSRGGIDGPAAFPRKKRHTGKNQLRLFQLKWVDCSFAFPRRIVVNMVRTTPELKIENLINLGDTRK